MGRTSGARHAKLSARFDPSACLDLIAQARAHLAAGDYGPWHMAWTGRYEAGEAGPWSGNDVAV